MSTTVRPIITDPKSEEKLIVKKWMPPTPVRRVGAQSPSSEKKVEARAQPAPELVEVDGLDAIPGVCVEVVSALEEFLKKYIIVPDATRLVIATWVVAAWLNEKWDRFPHLAVTSPEKRCGKTRLLQLLSFITPNACNTTNISPAAIYRLIEKAQPTLLLDEAQSVSRRGSETSEVLRELLNAGIDRNAKVLRVGGKNNNEVQEFKVYSPKVIALIGDLDGVLADRSLPVGMKRKTEEDQVEQYRSRVVQPEGDEIKDKVEEWTTENAERVAEIYDTLEPFDIRNDRMAELLLPLQAVLKASGDEERLEQLRLYAVALDEKERESERMSPGVKLLTACREIFANTDTTQDGGFLSTANLILKLVSRAEEPWARFNRGENITADALANLLRPFGIRSDRDKAQKNRGYFAHDFKEAWGRYLPVAHSPKTPSNPSETTETTKTPNSQQPGKTKKTLAQSLAKKGVR